MKNMKKILVLALTALLLVAVSVAGTVAYLTDSTEQVQNTFTATNLEINLAESVTPWQQKLLPGATYDKDPYVEVASGSESAWVFVEIVEANNTITEGKKVTYTVDTTNWVKLEEEGDHDGDVYLYKASALAAGDKKYLLTGGTNNLGQVKVNENVTEADMAALPTLTFYAYAVQSENLTINGTTINKDNVVNNVAAVWGLHAETPVTSGT